MGQLEHKFLCIKVFLLLIGLQGIILILLLRWDIIRKSPLYVNATAYEMWNAILLVLESPLMIRYTIYAFPARDLNQVNPLAELNRRAEECPIQALLLGADEDVSFKSVVRAMWSGRSAQENKEGARMAPNH